MEGWPDLVDLVSYLVWCCAGIQMSLLYGQLDEMDSSLDTLQAEMVDVAEADDLWTANDHVVI